MTQAIVRFAKSNVLVLLVATLAAMFVSLVAIAQDAVTLPVTPDFLDYLVASFNGIKGASVFGGAAIMIQVILKALDQPFAKHFFSNRSGLNKLLIVSALTFAVTPLGLVTGAGLTIPAALVHSSTLTAFMVFLNQLYQQAQKQKQGKAA